MEFDELVLAIMILCVTVSKIQTLQPKNNNDWKIRKDEDQSYTVNRKGDVGNNLDDTRRAVAQKRASKKLASIDWDIAAREEITALLSGNTKNPEEPSGADSDLEVVRRAIARRKAKGNTDNSGQQNRKSISDFPMNQGQAGENPANQSDEEEHGPRLDWLVDFISDEPSSKQGETPPKESRRPVENESNVAPVSRSSLDLPGFLKNAEQAPSLDSTNDLRSDQVHAANKKEKTPAKRSEDQNIVPPHFTIGDGYGNVDLLDSRSSRSKNNSSSTNNDQTNTSFDQANNAASSKPGAQNIAPERPIPETQNQDFTSAPGPPSSERKQSTKARKTSPLDIDALKTKDRVVGLLLKKQVVTMSQVYEAQKIKERESLKETLWRILVELNDVNKDAVYEEAARIYAFPVADVEGKLDAKFVRSVLETLSEENRERLLNLHLVPYECETDDKNGGVKLAFITHDPMRTEVRRVMKELKLDRFDLFYAPQSAVSSIITEAFPRKNEYLERMTEDPMAFDLGMSYEEADIIDEDALEAEISRSSLINLFEATLVEGVRQGASDVHIYPNAKKKVEIHFRVDGRLTLWHTEHKVHPEALLAVIKDNAMNVDRFERDAAQDGYIQRWIDDVLIRFRVSVLPIANISHEIRSESIVIRILDDRKVIRDLRKLGLLEGAMEKFEQAISQPHGMVILTGPTGSGKSTTLVAALHQVITGEVNVLTVEDPVEYIIPGVRQIKLNYKLELENALRAILRHDPDVVMVGEMRDRKTAELAIKLANTGHLTFSTLHTNDAPSAISRLYKMGIEPFLIAYAINLIVAQRLIRVLCSSCKQPDLDPDPVMLEKLGFTKEEISSTTFYVPGNENDCPVCKGVGYKGRRAVSEALYFSREVRHMIVEADKMIDEGAIKAQAVKEGMLTLRDSAREIVKLGQTSVREMIRVVTTDG